MIYKLLFWAWAQVALTPQQQFLKMQDDGSVVYVDDHEGRATFTLTLPDGSTIEHAYREEIINYIETGVFTYNEDL